jgi:hypothetical protein
VGSREYSSSVPDDGGPIAWRPGLAHSPGDRCLPGADLTGMVILCVKKFVAIYFDTVSLTQFCVIFLHGEIFDTKREVVLCHG